MNKQTKALKDLLEAVEHAIEIGDWKVDGRCDPDLAINRAKKALEQPASKNIRDSFNEMLEDKVAYYKGKQPTQEPVAWNEEEFNAIAYAYRSCPAHEVKMVSERYQDLVDYVLSIAHPAPQPAQEPVAWMELKEDAGYTEITVWQEPVSKKSIPLYTHPAPLWVGLSDDEIELVELYRKWKKEKNHV